MLTHYTSKYHHLTSIERHQIERWHHQEGLSNREIARRLGVAPQTINNEIKRGQVQVIKQGKYQLEYASGAAQRAYDRAHKNVGKQTKLTEKLGEEISEAVKLKYSPEVISHLLDKKVCARTIYNWIKGGKLPVRVHDMLYPRYGRKKQKSKRISKRQFGLSIEARAEAIESREEAGHYELDLVLLGQSGQTLMTLTERKYRTELIRLLENKKAETVNQSLLELQKTVTFKSITTDNGSEFARLHEVFDANKIYYCHAFASCEKGTNENHNRMIRRFLPKGTKETTAETVAWIENWINHYPRKMFGYKSSIQMSANG